MDGAPRVDERQRATDGGIVHPRLQHREPEQAGDADPGRASARENDPGVGQSGAKPA